MNKPMKPKQRAPLVEQIVNMSKWDKTLTWEALAAKTSGSHDVTAPCQKEPPEEKKTGEK